MTVLGEEIHPADVDPEDKSTLRLAWRHDDTHGYVFFNNYQRRRVMEGHTQVILEGICREPVRFPPIDIPAGTYGFFPYHMKLDDTELIYATAVPLCLLNGEEKYYVFYGEGNPSFKWRDGKKARIIQISREDALKAWKVVMDREYLFLSEGFVWVQDGNVCVTGGRKTRIKCFPRPSFKIPGFEECCMEGIFTVYKRDIPGRGTAVSFSLTEAGEEYCIYEIQMQYGQGILDAVVSLEYAGDSLDVYLDGELINDHFFNGKPVKLSMRYFDFPESIKVKIYPLKKNAPCYLEKRPEFSGDKICVLNAVTVRDEIR